MLFTTRISAVRAGPMNLSMETLYLLFFSIQDEQYHNKQHECVDLKLGGYYITTMTLCTSYTNGLLNWLNDSSCILRF